MTATDEPERKYYIPSVPMFPGLQRYFFRNASVKPGADFRLIEGMEETKAPYYEQFKYDCYD